jgi:UDP-N-acetylmuramyl tripeptide synthase
MSSPDPTAASRRVGLPLALARPIAALARIISRLTGREGAALPGKVLLTLSPAALATMARAGRRRGRRIVLVSATNGKTTTTALLVELLRASGLDVVTNVTGANLRSGIATTLLQAGRGGDIAVLETDEATLPLVAPDLEPDMIVLGNLFRDQLDRFGELEVLADRWRDTLAALDASKVTVVYNTDDPLISSLVDDHVERATREVARVLPFGLRDASVAQDGLPHAADSRFCRRCGHALDYEHSWVGHLGAWHCPSCGARPLAAETFADEIVLDGLAATSMDVRFDGGDVRVRLPIPGLYNVYNAVAAIAAAEALVGFDDEQLIAETIAAAAPAFGRFERIPVPSGGTITLLLVKNPTGLNEVVRTLVESGVELTATLFALNDGIADGRDTSWIWDADLEPLLERAGAMVVTGDRAAEFGLRAVYGGLDPDGVLLEPDLEQGMYRVLERAREFTEHGHAYALVTYTAMLRMRAVIAAQGWARAYWANEPRTRSRR